jgi:hypothetical protein
MVWNFRIVPDRSFRQQFVTPIAEEAIAAAAILSAREPSGARPASIALLSAALAGYLGSGPSSKSRVSIQIAIALTRSRERSNSAGELGSGTIGFDLPQAKPKQRFFRQ